MCAGCQENGDAPYLWCQLLEQFDQHGPEAGQLIPILTAGQVPWLGMDLRLCSDVVLICKARVGAAGQGLNAGIGLDLKINLAEG